MALAFIRPFFIQVGFMTKLKFNFLRVLGFIEGFSFIYLVFIAIPIRAMTSNHSIVSDAGTIHGFLFTIYVITLMSTASSGKWHRKTLFTAIFLSCLPFGTFIFDRLYLTEGE